MYLINGKIIYFGKLSVNCNWDIELHKLEKGIISLLGHVDVSSFQYLNAAQDDFWLPLILGTKSTSSGQFFFKKEKRSFYIDFTDQELKTNSSCLEDITTASKMLLLLFSTPLSCWRL